MTAKQFEQPMRGRGRFDCRTGSDHRGGLHAARYRLLASKVPSGGRAEPAPRVLSDGEEKGGRSASAKRIHSCRPSPHRRRGSTGNFCQTSPAHAHRRIT